MFQKLHHQEQIDELARELSDYERAVILAMSDGLWVHPMKSIARDTRLPVNIVRAILRNFRRRGLAIHGFLSDVDGDGMLRGSGTFLNDVGLAVQKAVRRITP